MAFLEYLPNQQASDSSYHPLSSIFVRIIFSEENFRIMNTHGLARATIFYTGIAGALTVGCLYLVAHSGLYMLIAMGAGILLVVLGGAASGPVSASAVGEAEGAGLSGVTEGMQLQPSMENFNTRAVLIFYGVGLILWSIVVLTVFRSGLQ
ncbi:hypothetical protein [Haladaptatus litoreus]|nr:hypothetical protein [Haladaptatus litoreus]